MCMLVQLKELVAQLFPGPEYQEQCRAAPQLLAATEDAERTKRPKFEESPREVDADRHSQSASPSSTGAQLV